MSAKKNLFHRFKLTEDKETAKYLEYNEMVYPEVTKQIDKTTAKAEMDSMWMVGFLDHEQQCTKERRLKDLQDYVALPQGNLVHGAAKGLNDLYRKPVKLERFETAGKGKKSKGPGAVKMADKDIMRLEELGKEVFKKKKKAGVNVGRKAYESENRKIAKLRRQRQPTGPRHVIESLAMDELYELERVHTMAARVIQKVFRSYLSAQFWKEFLVKVKAALSLQRLVRGMITRELIRLWYIRRNYLVGLMQSALRAYLTRKVWKTVVQWESFNASKIQQAARGFIARRIAREMQLAIASTRIQCLWRGICGRAEADRFWLDRMVSLQKLVKASTTRSTRRP